MTLGPKAVSATPFFLPAADTATGQRFCLLHEGRPGAGAPAAILYVHPFAEEMNRSRRMAALQARALADAGMTVLQIDLYGCGDSSDDFADARWSIWKADLALAHAWLAARTAAPVVLWGLRLGALLALDYAREATLPVKGLLLWQPVTAGRNYLTQFLRLRLASAALDGKQEAGGTGALRASLAAGSAIEVGGYELAGELAMAIDAVDAALPAPGIPVDWFDLHAEPDAPLLPATSRIAQDWQAQGIDLRLHQATGPAFWATAEITEAPLLIDGTVAALQARA